jgi:hypothetical protein
MMRARSGWEGSREEERASGSERPSTKERGWGVGVGVGVRVGLQEIPCGVGARRVASRLLAFALFQHVCGDLGLFWCVREV